MYNIHITIRCVCIYIYIYIIVLGPVLKSGAPGRETAGRHPRPLLAEG